MYTKIKKELDSCKEPSFAEWLKPYINFDEYQNEIVLGIRVPVLRKYAKLYKDISIECLMKFLTSRVHEYRLFALFVMLHKSKTNPIEMKDLYIKNINHINNWDLIDYTAPHIVAPYITKKEFKVLSNSNNLWANRIAMVSTIYYIKNNDFQITLELAKKYMYHPHHLMHKATGWMLREVGKRDLKVLIDFLNKYEKEMPSIMKAYAKEILKKY